MTKFKAGKTYKTTGGFEAEVWRTDGPGSHPILGCIKYVGGWGLSMWSESGVNDSPNVGLDLMPPTPKARGFVNVYERWVDCGFPTKDDADQRAYTDRIACIDLSQIDLTPFLTGDNDD